MSTRYLCILSLYHYTIYVHSHRNTSWRECGIIARSVICFYSLHMSIILVLLYYLHAEPKVQRGEELISYTLLLSVNLIWRIYICNILTLSSYYHTMFTAPTQKWSGTRAQQRTPSFFVDIIKHIFTYDIWIFSLYCYIVDNALTW